MDCAAAACRLGSRGLSGLPAANRRRTCHDQKPIIVFDLDGTLVDTAPDLLDSLNHSLGAGGVAAADAAGFRAIVGHGGRVMIERAYAAQQQVAGGWRNTTGC